MFNSKQQISVPSDKSVKFTIGWNVAGVPLETSVFVDNGDGLLTPALPADGVHIEDYFVAVSSFDLSKMPKNPLTVNVIPDSAVCSTPLVYIKVEVTGQPEIEWTQWYPYDCWHALRVLHLSPKAEGWMISTVAPKRSLKERVLARLGF